jgi:hypothetical protein
MPLEREFQPRLIKMLESRFPGCFILKNDPNYRQGVPDLLLLYGRNWAILEVKRKPPKPSDYEPNQEWYIEQLNAMSFSACVYPENAEEVLDALEQAFAA